MRLGSVRRREVRLGPALPDGGPARRPGGAPQFRSRCRLFTARLPAGGGAGPGRARRGRRRQRGRRGSPARPRPRPRPGPARPPHDAQRAPRGAPALPPGNAARRRGGGRALPAGGTAAAGARRDPLPRSSEPTGGRAAAGRARRASSAGAGRRHRGNGRHRAAERGGASRRGLRGELLLPKLPAARSASVLEVAAPRARPSVASLLPRATAAEKQSEAPPGSAPSTGLRPREDSRAPGRCCEIPQVRDRAAGIARFRS